MSTKIGSGTSTKKSVAKFLERFTKRAHFIDQVKWESDKEKQSAQNVIDTLISNPQTFHRVEAPAGYEQHLLASLRAKLDLPQPGAKVVTRPVRVDRRQHSWWQLRPSFAWSLVGSLSLSCAILAVNLYEESKSPTAVAVEDLIASTALESDAQSVDRWLASVGDSVIRMKSGHSDLHALSWEISVKTLDRAQSLEN